MNKSVEGVMGIACAYLGFSYNCVGKEKRIKAAKLLTKMKARHNFSDFYQAGPTLNRLAEGVWLLGSLYNRDYIYNKKKDPETYADIKFLRPRKGLRPG